MQYAYKGRQICDRRQKDRLKLSQKHCDFESKPNDSLTEEQWENFEPYLSITADLLDANCLDSFISGSRLGARFAHEIFAGTDAPFADLTKAKT
ncbi:MAG: hypothetical protein IJU41_00685 [Clostridia bacterium]|nr:hypothetical protein [Clostridia bacterium]